MDEIRRKEREDEERYKKAIAELKAKEKMKNMKKKKKQKSDPKMNSPIPTTRKSINSRSLRMKLGLGAQNSLPKRNSLNLAENQSQDQQALVERNGVEQAQVQSSPSDLSAWTTQMSSNLNRLRNVPSDHSFPYVAPMTTLSPALISENGGVQFLTQIIGARDLNGQLTFPTQFQMTAMTPRQRQLPLVSNRIEELPESTDESALGSKLPFIDSTMRANLRNQEQSESAPLDVSLPFQIPQKGQKINRRDLESRPILSRLEPQQQQQTDALTQPMSTTPMASPTPMTIDSTLMRMEQGQRTAAAAAEGPTSTTFGINGEQQQQQQQQFESPLQGQFAPSSSSFGDNAAQFDLSLTAPFSSDRPAPEPPPRPPLALDLFYNQKNPTFYSGMNLARFKRLNNPISLHKPFKSNFDRNPVIATGLFTCLFSDTIAAFKNFSQYNNDYRFILVVIDGLSRKSFVAPLRSTKSEETSKELDNIFRKIGEDLPGHTFFCTDQGSEFEKNTYDLLERWSMTPVHLQGPHKAAIVERFK